MQRITPYEIPNEGNFTLSLSKGARVVDAYVFRMGYKIKAWLAIQGDVDTETIDRPFIVLSKPLGESVDVPDNALGMPFIFRHEERHIVFYIFELRPVITTRLQATVKRIKAEGV